MRLIDADAYAKRLSALAKNAENNAMPMTAAQFKWTADDMKENAPTIGDWMRVEDGLPDKQPCEYLVVNGNNVETAICLDNRWITPRRVIKITHWMPLPEPPKEVEQDGWIE